MISVAMAAASWPDPRKTDRVQAPEPKASGGDVVVQAAGSDRQDNLLSGLEEALTETRRKIAEDRLDRAKEEMRILRQFSVSPAFLAQRAAAIGKELGSAATDYAELVRDSMDTAGADAESTAAAGSSIPTELPSTSASETNASMTTPTERDRETLDTFRSAIYQAWALLDLSLEDLLRQDDLRPSDQQAASSSLERMQTALHAMDNLTPWTSMHASAFHI